MHPEIELRVLAMPWPPPRPAPPRRTTFGLSINTKKIVQKKATATKSKPATKAMPKLEKKKPEPQIPDPQKVEPQKPEMLKPELQKPEPQKPEPQKPELQKPEPQVSTKPKPVLRAEFEPKQPLLNSKKPEPQKLEPQVSTKPKPVLRVKLEPKHPAINWDLLKPKKPEPQKLEPQKPELQKPEPKKPEPQKSQPQKPKLQVKAMPGAKKSGEEEELASQRRTHPPWSPKILQALASASRHWPHVEECTEEGGEECCSDVEECSPWEEPNVDECWEESGEDQASASHGKLDEECGEDRGVTSWGDVYPMVQPDEYDDEGNRLVSWRAHVERKYRRQTSDSDLD